MNVTEFQELLKKNKFRIHYAKDKRTLEYESDLESFVEETIKDKRAYKIGDEEFKFISYETFGNSHRGSRDCLWVHQHVGSANFYMWIGWCNCCDNGLSRAITDMIHVKEVAKEEVTCEVQPPIISCGNWKEVIDEEEYPLSRHHGKNWLCWCDSTSLISIKSACSRCGKICDYRSCRNKMEMK